MNNKEAPMIPGMEDKGGSMNLNQLEDMAVEVVYGFTSIVTMPVEMALRPSYGTRYFSPAIILLSLIMMAILPLFVGMAGAVTSLIPFAHASRPSGTVSLGTLSELFFLGLLVHGIRTWRRMLNMALEESSHFEGPPLPFFLLLPKGRSFWFTRIVWEPVFVFFLASFLQQSGILQSSAAFFLQFSAVMLAMKQYVVWFKAWSYLRTLLDMRYTGPIVAKLVENSASEEDLAQLHLPTFPKNLPPEIRNATARHIARAFSGPDSLPTKGENS
jgi:hypothetical protein